MGCGAWVRGKTQTEGLWQQCLKVNLLEERKVTEGTRHVRSTRRITTQSLCFPSDFLGESWLEASYVAFPGAEMAALTILIFFKIIFFLINRTDLGGRDIIEQLIQKIRCGWFYKRCQCLIKLVYILQALQKELPEPWSKPRASSQPNLFCFHSARFPPYVRRAHTWAHSRAHTHPVFCSEGG